MRAVGEFLGVDTVEEIEQGRAVFNTINLNCEKIQLSFTVMMRRDLRIQYFVLLAIPDSR